MQVLYSQNMNALVDIMLHCMIDVNSYSVHIYS